MRWWPFMLRSTHERVLEREVGVVLASNERLLLHSDALVERVVQEVSALDRRSPAQFAAEYFPAPAEKFPHAEADLEAQKAARLGPVEVRELTGPEVVQRAMNHRNLHKKVN